MLTLLGHCKVLAIQPAEYLKTQICWQPLHCSLVASIEQSSQNVY
uniref:Uncharacterized protein n=1 Tax=Rhizophora mucronata TaxID=61149 RepID=A0A2P2K6Y9_RHIMU